MYWTTLVSGIKWCIFQLGIVFRRYIQCCVFVYIKHECKVCNMSYRSKKVGLLTRTIVFHTCWGYDKIRCARNHHVLMNTSHKSTNTCTVILFMKSTRDWWSITVTCKSYYMCLINRNWDVDGKFMIHNGVSSRFM